MQPERITWKEKLQSRIKLLAVYCSCHRRQVSKLLSPENVKRQLSLHQSVKWFQMNGFVEQQQLFLFSRQYWCQGTYKFYLPKVEMFFKDDVNNDPQWSEEQIIAVKFCFAGLVRGQTEVDIMSHATQAIFEVLEKSCLSRTVHWLIWRLNWVLMSPPKKLFLLM